MPQIINRGQKPPSIFSNNKGSNEFNRYFYLRIGVIREIDYDKYEMIIAWKDQTGVISKIPISFPYAGPAGCMGMVPEIGSIGIFGYLNDGTGTGSPLCLAFLTSGLANALDYNTVKILPDSISSVEKNRIHHKFRRISEGEMIMASPFGGHILVNKDTVISDNMEDNLIIRGSDQSIIATSLNNFVFADGISIKSGQIIRNGLMLYDLNGNKIRGLNGSLLTVSPSRDNVYIVPFGKPVLYDSSYYIEHRVDVDEKGDGKLDINDINKNNGISTRDPIVSQILGNYVGDIKSDEKTYGKLLRPQIFIKPDDEKGFFSLLACNQFNGVDEPSLLGLAYALHFHKTGAFFGVDKEGHYYVNLGSSVVNPIGPGRSMSLNAQGSLKESWGAAAYDNNSWDLTTTGGVKWNIGSHNAAGEKKSIQISTSNSISIEAMGVDDSGNAKTETYFGNTHESVSGNKTVEVTETYDLLVKGLKSEDIYGSASESVQANKTVSVLEVYSEIVVKEKQQKYGKRKTTITSGNDELTVLAGMINETIATFGNKKTQITTGNIQEIIGTGNKTVTIAVGNFVISVSAGNVVVTAGASSITMTPVGAISIVGASTINMTAPLVNVGAIPVGAVVAGIPGIPSHFDYVVGIPPRGSLTVKTAL